MPGIMCQLPPGKVNYFGIEASSGITWTGWEPGREYTKNIVLKNIKAKPTKIKYKTPSSRYFTTLYPQPIALSAGNSFMLPITFRPLEKMVYEDRMEFVSSEGSFVVPMKAVLPQYDIQAPEIVHVGLCAVTDSIRAQVEIRNCSELVTSYQVECAEPFAVLPSEGILEPFSSSTLLIAFKPKAALVSDVDLVLSYGQDFSQSRIVRLRGIGKYPHLLISSGAASNRTWGELESELNFGQVFVGQTVQKWIEISNQSPVNAPFRIEHPLSGPTQVEQVFQCAQKNGVVPALNSLKIPFSFSPTTIGHDSVDYFYIQANGTPTKTVIRCSGLCKGPAVCLSQNLVNFQKAESGDVLTKPLEIINDSSAEATFQFQIDCAESVFKIDLLTGTLPPNSRKTVLLHFAPVHPINYYRRVACIIHNQGVVFLDLLGTCHTEVDKPAILKSCHIRRYRVHVERGLSLKAPEQLNTMFTEGQLVVDGSGALALPSQVGNISGGESHSTQGGCSVELSPADEYVNDGYHTEVLVHPPHVSVDVHQVDFGRVTDLQSFEHQIVSLTNHTQGKITVVWTGDSSRVFSVIPSTADILPQKSSVFKVAFRPDGPNKFFGSELECYAFYKSMRDFRLTDDRTHFPPWCITLTALGNTFQLNNEFFIPRFTMNPNKMSFSVINAHDSTYRTFLLTNTGTTPIMFDFEKESTGTFLLKPTRGLLAPSGNQVFVLKFRPANEKKTYKDTLKLRLNQVDKHTQSIMVYGKVELPQLLLDNNGTLYFKPTCTGTVSHRLYGIKNHSRVPVYFEWKLKNVDSKVLKVDPISGLIKPNEKQFHKWFFKPTAEEKYVMKPVLITWSQLVSESTSKSLPGRKVPFTVRAIGEGSHGQLVCQEKSVDCGPLVVGTVTNQHITLANDSLCNLSFKLHVTQNISGPYADEDLYQDALALELSKLEGMMAARTKLDIMVSMRPMKRVTYQWDISYSILSIEGDRIASSEMRPLCQITATGIFPTMVVTDARCHGSASGLSKKQLWSLFCLDNFNMFLDGDPATEELMYNVPTKHSLSRKPPIYTRAIIDFNFSSAPVGSEGCVVQLMFENNGAAACEWSFLYPTDLQLELEYWAETGEYDTDELHEMKILENKLFSIEPKKGKLGPGERCTVTLAYRHTMVGTDRLPVLLKLSYGREILLNFVGVTVEVDRNYIHFPSTRFMFAPVPIGETRGPTQVYEMYNGGAIPVQFEIDTFPLRELMQENYSHPIFECLNPKGEIQPGHTTVIEWKFSPLEARTYSVDIAIKIECGETAIITFTGVGFDKRLLGDTMPITDQLDQSGVPSVQSVPSPGQLCFLNQERISFGNMPLYTRGRRAVVMTNRSQKHSASFTWHVTNDKDAQYLTIFPISGTLDPGESAMFKATFMAVGIPAFYDVDLVCEVKNMTEQKEYETALAAWEGECRRQMVEFTITEKDPNADQHVSATECALEDGRPGSAKLEALESGRTVSPESMELLRYKTLPPISKKLTCDDKRLNDKLKRRFDEKFWPKPTKPKSFLLHLGLTVRTHDIVEFQQHFPQDYNKFFIDRTIFEMPVMPSAQELQEEQALSPKPVCCNQKEADMLALALSNIIRSLLDDTGFHEACHEVMEEPTPYFQQFCPTKFNSEKSHSVTDVAPSSDLRMASPDIASQIASEELQQKKEENRLHTNESGHRDSRDSSKLSSKMNFTTTQPDSSSPSPQNQIACRMTETGDQSPMQDPNTPDLFPEGVFGDMEERNFMLKQKIKKLPGVCSEVESVLENTLMNIVQEAFHREFNITARPRLVALPPRPIPLRNECERN